MSKTLYKMSDEELRAEMDRLRDGGAVSDSCPKCHIAFEGDACPLCALRIRNERLVDLMQQVCEECAFGKPRSLDPVFGLHSHNGTVCGLDVDQRVRRLRKENKRIYKQLRCAQTLLHHIWEEGESIEHDEDCPEDDTCECNWIVELNKAMKGFR
jgi:hypothetical protein